MDQEKGKNGMEGMMKREMHRELKEGNGNYY